MMARTLLLISVGIAGFLGFFFLVVFGGAVIAHWTSPKWGLLFEVTAPLLAAKILLRS